MKKVFTAILLAVAMLGLASTGCEKKVEDVKAEATKAGEEVKEAAKKVEDGAAKVGEKAKEATEKVGEKVDEVKKEEPKKPASSGK